KHANFSLFFHGEYIKMTACTNQSQTQNNIQLLKTGITQSTTVAASALLLAALLAGCSEPAPAPEPEAATPAEAAPEAAADAGQLAAAPAFSAEQLAARPIEHWPTNGGSLMNQR